jgi:lysozyme family protein
MQLTEEFYDAFNHAMLFEVGPWWDPTDPEVIAGLISTKQQRRKVGYVNIPADRGGETKYGISQRAHPGIIIRDINLDIAMDIYLEEYWLKGNCQNLVNGLSLFHFDCCVNHGIVRATKFLQQALEIPEDGIIGKVTLGAANESDLPSLLERLREIRKDFFHRIVKNNKSQSIFLNGWLTRADAVADDSINKIL